MASLRVAAPRAAFTLHAKQLQYHRFLPSIRHASLKTPPPPPPKPRVLEQPDKFRPPSHPSRIRTRGPRYVGPALSEQEIQTQKTKQYPHMMPPEGTFLHWFLTHRTLHTWITMVVLFSLVFLVWLSDFLHKTPYLNLLPPNSMFFVHPIRFLHRWAEVYQMHVAHTSAETAERRRRRVEDVAKRAEYRKAHGLEPKDENTIDPLTIQAHEGEQRAPAESSATDSLPGAAAGTEPEVETYVDFEGNRQVVRKKWFGIW